MRYTDKIINSVKGYPELKIIDTQKLYSEKFTNIPEPTFYKVVSRMTEKGELQRLTKGIYCKSKQGRFGVVLSNEKNILEYYLGEKGNQGVVIGYQLFNKYGLTTQISKVVEAYSRNITPNNKTIKNVKARKVNLKLDSTTIKMIELLEILQEYMNIEDLNKKNFIKYLEETAKYYDEQVINKVLNSMNYKKSTIASLKNVLDYYGVNNNISKYLNGTSKYKALTLEELYDSTSKKRRIWGTYRTNK